MGLANSSANRLLTGLMPLAFSLRHAQKPTAFTFQVLSSAATYFTWPLTLDGWLGENFV